jgi:NADH:ubiquinone oxidoreductase subunit 2 (subunit N)
MLISKVKSIFSTKLVVDLVFPILLTILIMLTQFSNGFFSLSYANFFLFNNLMVYFIYGLLFLIFFIFFLSRFYFIFENFMVLEYVIFLLFVLQASIMLLKLNNLFMIYVVIEMQNFCFYILAAMKRYSNFSTEAGLKYFLLGSFSSGLLLFGISTLYINIGTLDITELLYFSGSNSMFFIAIVFILIGLFFKFGLAPFH